MCLSSSPVSLFLFPDFWNNTFPGCLLFGVSLVLEEKMVQCSYPLCHIICSDEEWLCDSQLFVMSFGFMLQVEDVKVDWFLECLIFSHVQLYVFWLLPLPSFLFSFIFFTTRFQIGHNSGRTWDHCAVTAGTLEEDLSVVYLILCIIFSFMYRLWGMYITFKSKLNFKSKQNWTSVVWSW